MNVKELKKHCKELNKFLEDPIDLGQDEEELLESFITSMSEVQEHAPDAIKEFSDDLIGFYNDLIADMFAGEEEEEESEEEQEEESEEESEEEQEEESEEEEEEKPAKKEKAKKPAKEKAPKKEKAKKEPKPKKEKPVKEPKPPREKKSGKKTWLTDEHKTAGGETRLRYGKVKPFYSRHQGSGSNFGKEEQPKDDLGAVLGSGTAKINEILLGKGATVLQIAEKLGTKEGRVKNHIYALKRSGVEFTVKDGKYKVSNIPEDYYKQA